METMEPLHSFVSDVDSEVNHMTCSYDNNLLFIAHKFGDQQIVDIENDKILETCFLDMTDTNNGCVSFAKDSQSAWVSENGGYIKKITVTKENNSGYKVDLNNKSISVADGEKIDPICLTGDGKSLLIGESSWLKIFDINTKELTKEYNMSDYILQIKLIGDGQKALIAVMDGTLSILDLELQTVTKIVKLDLPYEKTEQEGMTEDQEVLNIAII